MKIAAILTGKGSSQLKNKNLIKILGKPLMHYSCFEAKKCKEINRYYVSSEDNKILNYAFKLGYKKIKRPRNLSKKNTLHIDVINHALNFINDDGYYPDILIILLANAPMIKSSWIKKSIDILKKNKNFSSVIPSYAYNDHNPYRAKIKKGKFLKSFINSKKKISSNRQYLPVSYFLSHNFWAIRLSSIKKQDGDEPWKFMGKKVFPLIVNRTFDVHDQDDISILRVLLKKFLKN